jgi:hypothetical protein
VVPALQTLFLGRTRDSRQEPEEPAADSAESEA